MQDNRGRMLEALILFVTRFSEHYLEDTPSTRRIIEIACNVMLDFRIQYIITPLIFVLVSVTTRGFLQTC